MLRKTPLVRKTPLKRSGSLKRTAIKKRATPINKQSKKEAARQRKYMPIRNKFLSENEVCQMMIVPECSYFATEVHHPEGKIEDLLWDASKFVAACRFCHIYVELHPTEAKEKMLSADRLNKK